MTENVVPLRGIVPQWTFADRLRKVRRDTGLTQAEFSERLKVGPKAYATWEAGRYEPSSIVETAEQLERVTGVPRQWFLGWLDAPTPPAGGGAEGDVVRHQGLEPRTRWSGENVSDLQERRRFATPAERAA